MNMARDEDLHIIPLDVVALHDSPNDCWVVLYDRVYDITPLLSEHPGGMEVLLEQAGRDCSLTYQGVGHSAGALVAMSAFLVGILPEHERIFCAGRLRMANRTSSTQTLLSSN